MAYVSVCFSMCSLLFIIIIASFYFLKPRMGDSTNKLYSIIIICNILGLIIDILGYFIFFHFDVGYEVKKMLSKLNLFYYFLFYSMLSYYVLITFNNIKNTKIYDISYFVFVFIIAMILKKLEITLDLSMNIPIPKGPSVVFIYTIAYLFIVFLIIEYIKNRRKVSINKKVPIVCFLITGLVATSIQMLNSQITLLLLTHSLVVTIMYFTLENPDVKMLEEFRKNKEFGEAVNREKELFLFNLTKEIRNPLNDIGTACDQLNLMTDNKEIKKGIHYISYKKNNCLATINNMLDTSNMDINRIKVYNSKYNTKLLFEEITRIVKKDVKEGVDFRVNIDKSIPEKLYGDSIRIKQICKILLDNSIKHTTKGFIELEAHEITKNEICRLIITIEDSGSGIEIDKLDKIFASTNIEIVDDLKDNLVTAKSLSVVMGGLLTFTSELGKGSKFTFVVDQKIDDEKSKELKKIEENIKLITKENIIVVSEDKDYLEKLFKKLSKNNFEVSALDYGSKCLQKLRHNTNFKYIILDEDLSTINVDDMLTKLKEIPNFKSLVYVLTKNIKSDKYVKRGFDGVLSKKLTIKDINNLTK